MHPILPSHAIPSSWLQNYLLILFQTWWTDEHHENWSLPKSATGLNVTACRSAMCRAKNVVVSGGLLRLLSEQDENDKTRCTQLGKAWKYRLCFRESWVKEICWDGSRSYKHLLLIKRFKIDHLVFLNKIPALMPWPDIRDFHGPFHGCTSFVNTYSRFSIL